jgi:hypothetical protein
MRHILIIMSFVAALSVFQACKKSPASFNETNGDQALIQSAKAYFQSNLQGLNLLPSGNKRQTAARSPYWEAAYCINSSKGRTVVVPVFYQKNLVVKADFLPSRLLSLNYVTSLLIYKDSSSYHSELASVFPDSLDKRSQNGQFSGLIFTETWQGRPIKKYKISQGLTLTGSNDPPATSAAPGNKVVTGNKETDLILANCGTISGFNYSEDDLDATYAWTEPAGCTYEYLADPEGPGPGPGALLHLRPPISLATITINPPNNIIGNIIDYFKCFTNYGGTDHTYQVMICVDQPLSGSRTPWAPTISGAAGSSFGSNPVDVGHTYLVLSENFSGYSIVRNVGFYPQTNVYPWTTSAQGQLNDDDGHSYNISLTVTVDNGQFFNILNYISQGNNAGYLYDLNTNNCTSFALHALDAGNVVLPSTVGNWPDGGFGNDPGDLGEDIRNLSLSSNMTRSTSYNDHPNQYTCN